MELSQKLNHDNPQRYNPLCLKHPREGQLNQLLRSCIEDDLAEDLLQGILFVVGSIGDGHNIED